MPNRFLLSFAIVTLFLSGQNTEAVVIPGSAYGFNLISPVLKPGLDSTTGNWVDSNLVTWSKTLRSDLDYGGVQHFCEKKSESDGLQWQLPTSEQAERFYLRAARFNLLKKKGWELGSIWLQPDGNDKNSKGENQSADLETGILYLDGNSPNHVKVIACVALPQGFDKSGNYFDGKNTWSKTTAQSYSYPDAIKRCAALSAALPGDWKLPTFEQLEAALAQPLQTSEQFRKNMKKNGWAFGTALVQSGTKSENYKMLYSNENSRIVTCVR